MVVVSLDGMERLGAEEEEEEDIGGEMVVGLVVNARWL